MSPAIMQFCGIPAQFTSDPVAGKLFDKLL